MYAYCSVCELLADSVQASECDAVNRYHIPRTRSHGDRGRTVQSDEVGDLIPACRVGSLMISYLPRVYQMLPGES